ncbi:hypothetical protein ACFOPX_05585 [Helicobacter baculiformis]|uniref:Uncharacterized protein n=1 Tax=Helicobacter baculiformis TaxID=427351 RepID=A0ABV7ZLG1_9HELI|nr:hypothetical protein [Helicobacter baculiformis]
MTAEIKRLVALKLFQQGFSIVDERRNTDECYHIEIVQPHAN